MKIINLIAAVCSITAIVFAFWWAYVTAVYDDKHKVVAFILAAAVVGMSIIVCIVLYRASQVHVSNSSRRTEPTPSTRRTFFFSPGVAVSLNRSAAGSGTVMVNLHILSTEPTELIYIRLQLTDSTGLHITCEHSEPLAVGRFDLTAKTIEQKITSQELEKFQKGMLLNVDGYAKFRDGSGITQERISLTTIPNV